MHVARFFRECRGRLVSRCVVFLVILPLAGVLSPLVSGEPLKPGMSGQEVRKLQLHLAALGFALEVDGVYGAATRQAVMAFQSSNGLEANGIADQATLEMLYSIYLPSAKVSPSDAHIPRLGDRVLSRGAVGSDVFALQRLLKSLGYRVIIDGRFDELVEQTVLEFQESRGLDPDGRVGPATLEALRREASRREESGTETGSNRAESEAESEPSPARIEPGPESLKPTRPPNQPGDGERDLEDTEETGSGPPIEDQEAQRERIGSRVFLKLGTAGDDVRELQQRLMNLGYDLDVDGYYGPKTRRAVMEFQEANGMTTDGIAGPKTLEMLRSIRPTYIYVVQHGDSLWSIAQAFDITVEALTALNDLDSETLRVGQKLKVPARLVYRIRPGDTLWDIAQRFQTTVDALVRLNHLDRSPILEVGVELILPREIVSTQPGF